MSKTLACILRDGKIAEVKASIRDNGKISLFTPYSGLGGKTLFAYFQKHEKLKDYTLEKLIRLKAVDITESDESKHTLIQALIAHNDIGYVQMVLRNGGTLSHKDIKLARSKSMLAFLNYRPGSTESRLITYCVQNHAEDDYMEGLKALFLDYEDTTDGSSSEEEAISCEESLSESEEHEKNEFRTKQLNKFKKSPDTAEGLCLVAARGVHFCPTYFSRDFQKEVKEDRHQKHPTFSQSTLFDAGYETDIDVSEKDKNIQERHKYNLKFIKKLKGEKDHKEVKIRKSRPPATRNNHRFESLYYRYMQVYINSYRRLITMKAIMIDFGFDSTYNPEVSASWYFDKGAMYGSGHRFAWKNKKLRKNPHYRRFTGKPKHPNMGYLDVYAFDVEYVREHGFDRLLMCANKLIKLNAMYRSEGEIIFHSMIPSRFHIGRHILSVPSFELKYDESNKTKYGLLKGKYTELKNTVRTLPADKDSIEYKKFIDAVTEKSAKAQGGLISKTTQIRLFRNEEKIVVYDHGNSLRPTPFTCSSQT